jgi:hypothetical protein
MVQEKPWIEVPQLFDDEQLQSVQAEFSKAGVVFSSEPIALIEAKYHQEVKHTIYVSRIYARQAARILAEILELEDPADDTPFTGDCPACGTKVTNSWSCPSCELGFHSRFDADDPMIVFVRENGGFR